MASTQDQWMQTLGVPADKFAAGGDADNGGSGTKPATQWMKFGGDVGLPSKKVKVWGGRIEIELAIKPHISGRAAIDDTNKTKLTSVGTKAVFNWQGKTADPILRNGNIFSNLKLARQGASLVATSSTPTAIGKFDLTITFVKLDKKLLKDASLKLGLKILEVEGTLEPAKLKLPDQEIEGVKLSDLELSVAGSITIAPQWREIIEKWAVEAGKDYLKDAAESAAEDAAVVVSGEVVIAGSIVLAGVATIAAAVYSIVEGWAIGDLAQDYAPSVAAIKAGFKAGMSGGSEPGDRFGKAGYTQGKKNYDLLFSQAKKDNSGAPDDAIKKAIAAKADDALKQVSDALDKSVRVGLWDGYLGQHTTLLLSGDAKWAYVACFGDLPSTSASEWKKYVDQHPTQSKL